MCSGLRNRQENLKTVNAIGFSFYPSNIGLVYMEIPSPEMVDSVSKFLISIGYWKSLGIFAIIIILFTARRLYSDRRKDKEVNLLIEEKERTIQRLAKEAREYKILYFKKVENWSDEDIEHILMKNDFTDGVEARKHMEGENHE